MAGRNKREDPGRCPHCGLARLSAVEHVPLCRKAAPARGDCRLCRQLVPLAEWADHWAACPNVTGYQPRPLTTTERAAQADPL